MIVVDASVAIKWVKKDEKDQEKAFELYQAQINNQQAITVPKYLFVELANALVTKSDFLDKEVKTALEFIYQANLSIYEVDKEDIFQASALAKKYKTTVYDMLYAVVAKIHKTILVTADEKFIAKTRFSFVRHLTDMV